MLRSSFTIVPPFGQFFPHVLFDTLGLVPAPGAVPVAARSGLGRGSCRAQLERQTEIGEKLGDNSRVDGR